MSENPDFIEVQKYLRGVDYPASRDDLVTAARENGAPDDIVAALESSGRDSFDNPTEVSEAVTGS